MEEAGWKVTLCDDGEAGKARLRLEDMRRRIDELDKVSASLLGERLRLAAEIAEVKSRLGMPVLDPEREAEVMAGIRETTGDVQLRQSLCEIWESVMAQSRKLQKRERAAVPEARVHCPDAPARPATLYFPRVLVIGLGLIGGVFARQIRKKLPSTEIIARDSQESIEAALLEGVIDGAAADLAKAVRRASLIILAASPAANLSTIHKLAPLLRRGQLVIDVTSTKKEICRAAANLDLNGAEFIGCHPLFGSEKSGFPASAAVIADGQTVCVIPPPAGSDLHLRRLCRFLASLDFKLEMIDAERHDQAAARLSHLIQLTAVALGSGLAAGVTDEELAGQLALAGPSFRQLARLMKSPPALWQEIVGQNREPIAGAIEMLATGLQSLQRAVELDDRSALDDMFQEAARIPPLLD